jgi:cytidine deaminase
MAIPPELLEMSRRVLLNAYAPYSGFSVGAAILFDGSSQIFTGANVENQSYGLTICAERSAVFAGVSAGLRKITHVAISCRDKNGNLVAAKPCGACLQVIAEFGTRETQLWLADGYGYCLFDFLPRPFGL